MFVCVCKVGNMCGLRDNGSLVAEKNYRVPFKVISVKLTLNHIYCQSLLYTVSHLLLSFSHMPSLIPYFFIPLFTHLFKNNILYVSLSFECVLGWTDTEQMVLIIIHNLITLSAWPKGIISILTLNVNAIPIDFVLSIPSFIILKTLTKEKTVLLLCAILL